MSSGIYTKSNGFLNRSSIRLKEYDYSEPGAYYVTLCTYNRNNLFGKIINNKTVLNVCGEIAKMIWLKIPEHFPFVELDEFIIMPNHVHGIIIISYRTSTEVKDLSPLQIRNNIMPHGTSKTIGSIIRGYKIGITNWIRHNTVIKTAWQRNYYEHIIRSHDEMNWIREYIINNPKRWDEDKYNKKSRP